MKTYTEKDTHGMSNHENVDDVITAVNGLQEQILELITEFGGLDESIAELTERIQATGINAPQGFFQAQAQNEQVRVTLSNARHKAQEMNGFLESTKDFG